MPKIDLIKGMLILKNGIKTEKRHIDYDRVTELAKKYSAFVVADDQSLDTLLIQFNPRETQEAFDQRKKITSLTTPDIANTLCNPLYKVGRTTPNEKISWSKEEKAEEKRKQLTDVASKYYGDMSVVDYLTIRLPQLDTIDPNSFIVTEFEGEVNPADPKTKAKPYPFEVSSKEAIDYAYINNELQYLLVYLEEKDRYTIYLENESIVADKVKKEDLAKVILQLGEKKKKFEVFYKDESNKENSDIYIIQEFTHKAGIIPARRVGTVKDPETRFRTCVPVIHPAKSYFEKAVKTVSEFDLTNAMHVFPKIFRYDEPCKGDLSKGMICNDGKDGSDKACSVCGGTGWKRQTSTADEVIIRMPKELKDIVSLENMMAYKGPSVDLIKFQKEYGLYELKELAIKAVYNGDTFIGDTISQTATEANINLESVYDTIKPFADNWSGMYKHIMNVIAAYRDLSADFTITHNFPKDFKMKPLTVLLDDLKKANDSGAPSYVKKSIIHDINKKIYIDSPDDLLKLQVKERFFPFNGKTESEINYILANGLISNFDKTLYAKFDYFFDEIEQEQKAQNIEFYKMDPVKQKELIVKKVDEYITLIDAEATAVISKDFNTGD